MSGPQVLVTVAIALQCVLYSLNQVDSIKRALRSAASYIYLFSILKMYWWYGSKAPGEKKGAMIPTRVCSNPAPKYTKGLFA